MELCELLSMTNSKVNLIDLSNNKPDVILQVRNALLASVYLPYGAFHGEVVNIEPSKEYNTLDVRIIFANEERDKLEQDGTVELSEDDYE